MTDSSAPATLLDVARICDSGPHNAFTDLVFFRAAWWCAFREAEAHVSREGTLRLLRSSDGRNWQPVALIEEAGRDLRDPKLSLAPDGRLCLLYAAIERGEQNHLRSELRFSSDGLAWDQARQVGADEHWLWRLVWRGEDAYGFAYICSEPMRLQWYQGGVDTPFVAVGQPRLYPHMPNESGLVFLADGSALCLLRCNRSPGLLGRARPPYTDWYWQSVGLWLGGPQLLQLPDGRLLAATRAFVDEQIVTALYQLHPDEARLEHLLTLPSGGDTSYPGLDWRDDTLRVSYYSEHEGRCAIYFATVTLPLLP
jgi:hypothetical protein